MKRYMIKYRSVESQTDYHVVYSLGEEDLSKTIDEIIQKGCFVDWIGSRDEHDNIAHFWEIRESQIMTKEQRELNFKNEQSALDEWGY